MGFLLSRLLTLWCVQPHIPHIPCRLLLQSIVSTKHISFFVSLWFFYVWLSLWLISAVHFSRTLPPPSLFLPFSPFPQSFSLALCLFLSLSLPPSQRETLTACRLSLFAIQFHLALLKQLFTAGI